MTLTSDLVLIIIVSGAYLLLFEIGIPNLVCECILGWLSVLYHLQVTVGGAQWLSGRVLDSRPKGRGFEPHRRHCVVSLSKTHLS